MTTHLPVVRGENTGKGSLLEDGRRRFIAPADVRGRFHQRRGVVFAVLIVIYVALPWITIGGRPAVLLDIPRREFFLFGATFNAQDVWLAFFVVTGAAFALIGLTALLGRIWCGWACPQTVFLDGVFRRIERMIEGPREQRLRRRAGPWTGDRAIRVAVKHVLYLGTAFMLAHVLLTYFVPPRELFAMMARPPTEHPEPFAWAFGITAALYADFAFFREQLCLVVCPYGRLQSVLTDADSVTIGYDARRGEPRGKAKEKEANPSVGDCVDCRRCVVVCPTGIDIRDGMQLDCIGCTACIDACDEIMDRLGRPRGLVRYDSLNGIDGKPKRVVRPRLFVYGVLGIAGLIAASMGARAHEPFEANLARLPGPPYVIEASTVRNTLDLHLVNKEDREVTFELRARADHGVTVALPAESVTVGALQGRHLPVLATAPLDAHVPPTARLHVSIRRRGDDRTQVRAHDATAPFVAPY